MKKTLLLLLSLFSVVIYAQNGWIQKSNFLGGKRYNGVAFSIGNKGYYGTGLDSNITSKKDFWEYDPLTDTWTQKADFGGIARENAFGLTIGNKGYIGTGKVYAGQICVDVWEYDPLGNTWTQKADFGGFYKYSTAGFTIGNTAYVGTGYLGSMTKDFWAYDPVTNVWTQKASYGGPSRYSASGCEINGKGYLGLGWDSTSTSFTVMSQDWWEYDPLLNNWTAKASLSGPGRREAVCFSMGNYVYVFGGGGGANVPLNDIWRYDAIADTWTMLDSMPASGRFGASAFTIGNDAYIVGGGNGVGSYISEVWKYTPAPAGIKESKTSKGNIIQYLKCNNGLAQLYFSKYIVANLLVYATDGKQILRERITGNHCQILLQPGVYVLKLYASDADETIKIFMD